jgi:hypothetical protein
VDSSSAPSSIAVSSVAAPDTDTAGMDAAYTAYQQVMVADIDPDRCQQLLSQVMTGVQGSDLPSAQSSAAAYRTDLFTADAAIRKLTFPDQATSAVNDELQANRVEIADLDAFASVQSQPDAYVAAMQIEVDDDTQEMARQAVLTALGHADDDPWLPVQQSMDQLYLAHYTLTRDVQDPMTADQQATGLQDKQAAAAKVAPIFARFVAAVGAITFPTAAQSQTAALTAATTAMTTGLQADQQATSTSGLNDDVGTMNAVLNAASALEKEIGDELAAAPPPDLVCPGDGSGASGAGSAASASGAGGSASASSGGTSSGSSASSDSSTGATLTGTGWTAALPDGWVSSPPQSGDDVDLTASDGGAVVIAQPQHVSSTDPATVGKAEVKTLTSQGYQIQGSVQTGTWAGEPAYQLTLVTSDGSLDMILTGVIHDGAEINVTVGVPDDIASTTDDANVLDDLQASWQWS